MLIAATNVKVGKWDAEETSPHYIRPNGVCWIVKDERTMLGPYVVQDKHNKSLYDPAADETIQCGDSDVLVIPMSQIDCGLYEWGRSGPQILSQEAWKRHAA